MDFKTIEELLNYIDVIKEDILEGVYILNEDDLEELKNDSYRKNICISFVETKEMVVRNRIVDIQLFNISLLNDESGNNKFIKVAIQNETEIIEDEEWDM